jgi:hypothetical protein
MGKDIIHQAVKNALIKDNWIITHDPYTIQFKDELLYADLAAERTIAAERKGQKIIVEIKSFIGRSTIQDFKLALGQYILYRQLLDEIAATYKLYLAVSDDTYTFDFQRTIIQFIIHRNQIPLIIVNTAREEIVEWIN